MKKCCLMVFALLLLLLCACVKQAPAGAAAERAENNTIPRSENQSAAAAEKQDPQSEDPAQAAFTGGITLYAGRCTAYVNSEPVEMSAAPFVENGNFYIPLQFVAETMGWSYQEQDGTVTLASSSHQTTLTVGMRTICIDGDRAAVNSYDWQFPEEDPQI